MQLMTQEIAAALPPLYANDGKYADLDDVPVVIQYFHPMSSARWFVTEGSRDENGDWTFFGWACLTGCKHDGEWGYIQLSELASAVVYGLGTERELSLTPGKHSVKELQGIYYQ